MLARFFIDRPIFATVVSVVITLCGGIAMVALPIAQYPQITPPSVSLSISYPGANAQVVQDTIAAPIEQAVNGVPGMLYMSSTSGSDGSYSLSITFEVGTNLNTALVMVQNRVALALPLLPTEVQAQGITVRKKSPDQLMIVSFYSSDANYIDRDLSNFALINLKDEILRVPGVSDVSIMGERDYAIRIWLDPRKLASRGMTAMDVASAVRSQSIQAAPGQTGQPPASVRQTSQLPIDILGRLSTPEQFGDIVVKVGAPAPARPRRPRTRPPAGATPPCPARPVPRRSKASRRRATQTAAAASSSSSTSSSSGATSSGGANSSGGDSSGGGTSSGGANSTGGATGIRFPSQTASGTSNSLSADTAASGGGGGGASAAPGAANVLTTSALSFDGAQGPSASIVRLRDVADIELGAANYSQYSTYDFNTAVGLSVYQLPGTNALDVAEAVRQRLKELEPGFPPWVKYEIGYDTTPFIRESIADVKRTLFEAIVLVGLVVLVFLQDWRAMILPMIDVPVSLIGTFAIMALLGYSLNNISLFGLVLAIGIVVDDAIVVLENIERQMAMGLDARAATIKAMEEITGPILAITLVLCAVFVPCAFIPGITGRFFQQFAVTISASMIISAVNAMTMTPSRAMLIFKARETGSAGPWASSGGAAVVEPGPRRGRAHRLAVAAAGLYPEAGLAGAASRRRSDAHAGLAASDLVSGPDDPAAGADGEQRADLAVLDHHRPSRPSRPVGRLAGGVVRRAADECNSGLAPARLQSRLRRADHVLRLDHRPGAARERTGFAGLPRSGRFDVLGVYRGPHRIHPRDGPGPADRQPPVARCGGARADQGCHGQGGQDHSRQPRRGPHDHQRRLRRRRHRVQLGVDVRDPETVRGAAKPRPQRQGHHQAAQGRLG